MADKDGKRMYFYARAVARKRKQRESEAALEEQSEDVKRRRR